MIIASKRRRPARAVGGEAWVRGASFVFPIDSVETFSVAQRGRPARAVGGEAWVRGASFVFPIDLFESSRPPHSFPANQRAVEGLGQLGRGKRDQEHRGDDSVQLGDQERVAVIDQALAETDTRDGNYDEVQELHRLETATTRHKHGNMND